MKRVYILLSGSLIFFVGILIGFIMTAKLKIDTKAYAENPIKEIRKEEIKFDSKNPFAKIAQEVIPGVVNIKATKKVKRSIEFFFPFEDPFFKKFFREFIPEHPQEYETEVLGSGFIFQKENDTYYLLTNYHVIKDVNDIIITLWDKREFKGKEVKIIGKDKLTDVAVLSVKTKEDLKVLKLGDSDKINVGDWAIAVGNPFGFNGTVTVGVISALGRSHLQFGEEEGPVFQNFIQTDAAINPGNSGGPLLNIEGEVIGINSAIFSTMVRGNIGIGFAIPINTAKNVAKQLIEKGEVRRGYLGVKIQEVDADLAKAYGLEKPIGALVTEVVKGEAADKAGVKEGEIIIKVNDEEVKNVEDLRLKIISHFPGEVVKLTLINEDGKKREVNVKLGELKEEMFTKGEEESKEVSGWLGIEVKELTKNLKEEYNIKGEKGVVIVNIDPEGSAYKAGLREGDLIYRIGKININDIKDYERARKLYEKENKPIPFHIERQGNKRIIAISP
ncbi:MAG: Do family serine endopeptidase [candidate division WOR-3 bacterium]|uniref:Do family serine endopeptidase n=1 Tax=candidate division WOR-3 bacterium TaxID=2052148 RepID=A0A7V4AB79_UNCW3